MILENTLVRNTTRFKATASYKNVLKFVVYLIIIG